MENTLKEIIARIAELQKDFSGADLLRDDLEIDSFRMAEIAFEIERVFEIRLPDEKYAETRTMDDILKLIVGIKEAP